jgi:hypothetical protein
MLSVLLAVIDVLGEAVAWRRLRTGRPVSSCKMATLRGRIHSPNQRVVVSSAGAALIRVT